MEPIQPIEWPVVEITAGRSLTFKVGLSVYFTLSRWGASVNNCTWLQLAAASAGNFVKGKWQSEGYEKPIHLIDDIGEDYTIWERIQDAAWVALKKAHPELIISKPQAAPEKKEVGTEQSPKTNGCASGLSELHDPDLDLTQKPSGV